MTIALSLKGGFRGYSLTELTLRVGALLLPPIPEGVIGVAWRYPRKKRTIRSLGRAFRTQGRIIERTKI